MNVTLKLLAFALPLAALSACDGHKKDDYAVVRSLTGSKFTGKKYYFGFGMNDNGVESMNNEVKYDVLHTHDIFTKQIGGNYVGKKLIGEDQVDGGSIKQEWSRVGALMNADDMYVQYSSGHGYQGGLAAGVTYDDIVNAAVSFKAKETVILTMACFSGGLVDTFKQDREKFKDYEASGRTLFVMASSPASQESSTGPGTDDAENGPDGSAGSAFGHSVWKSLAGDADGFVDGVKDGFIDLTELEAYTKALTQQIGRHMPQAWGINYQYLIMNEVPGAAYRASVKGGTEGMTVDQVRASAAELDRALAN